MDVSFREILDMLEESEATPSLAFANENTGYDPYDNPGTHKETPDDAS